MKKVARHPADLELARERVEKEAELLALALDAARRNPAHLNQLFSTARSYAGYLSVVEPGSPEICRALQVGAQAAAVIFALASAAEGEVEVRLGEGPPARLPVTGPTDASFAGNWRHGFYVACICRDRAALDILCRTPVEALRQSSTKVDECLYLFVEALQGLWRHEPNTAQLLLTALKATEPGLLRISPQDFVLNVAVPEMELVYRYMIGDETGFEEALVFALERHKKYWSKGDRKRDPMGYLALGPLAITAFAYDAGKSLAVESDYLPMRLVRGDCALAAS